MPVSTKPVRGMKSIRTIGGMADAAATPHKAYMRLFVLELEKARRQQERDSAARRVQNIDTRFREIEAEKTELLAIAGACRTGDNADPAERTRRNNGTRANSETVKTPRADAAGFKVRY